MTMSKVKRANSAETKKAKGQSPKLIEIQPSKSKAILERGNEFLSLRRKGYSQSQIIAMYGNAGIEVSTPAYYSAIKIARAPKAVRDLIREGKVAPTLVLPFLKKRMSDPQIVQMATELAEQREKHSQFLQKSGFAEGSKLTLGRAVAVIRKKLERLQKTNALSERGQAALALTKALANVHDAESIDALVAGFSGRSKK